MVIPHTRVVVVLDSHIQRIVLATEETTATKQVSHRPIKRRSRSWSLRRTEVNGSHHGDGPLLKQIGIQIATESLPGPTNREPVGVKTMSFLSKNYSFCIVSVQHTTHRIGNPAHITGYD